MVGRPGVNGGRGGNPGAEIFGRRLFEIGQKLRVRADDFGEEIGVGCAGQDLALLSAALAGKVIARAIDECDQVALRFFVQGGVWHPIGSLLAETQGDVLAEVLLTEEHPFGELVASANQHSQ